MSVFSDLLLEFGSHRMDAVPTRGGPWTTVLQTPSYRLRTAGPRRDVPILTHVKGKQWELWAVGEIDAYDGRGGTTNSCLRLFLDDLHEERARASKLTGRFLIAGWCGPESKWAIWTDRTSAIHAYVTGDEGRLALGTFSASVYCYSQRELDWMALASFFSLGFFPADTTFYRDCRVLRPASCYEFSSEGKLSRHTTYWQWTHNPRQERSEDDTIDEFGQLLSTAVARHVRNGRAALPLSGGLDSRTVAACLPEGVVVPSYSYGYREDSVEIELSSQVARVAGLPFHPHVIRPYLFERLPSVLDAVEGFQDLTQTRQADMAGWLGDQADYVVGAHWGDVLCDSLGVEDLAGHEGAFAILHGKMVKNGSAWFATNLCGPQLPGVDVARQVRDQLRKEFDRFEDIEDADFRAKAVKTSQWAYRWTLPSIRAYELGAVPRLPFLDSAMLDFFCTVPTSMVRGRRLQIEYLKRYAPAMAAIRWQAYDSDLYKYQHFGTLQLPRRAWRRFLRAVDTRPRIRRNWEIQFCSNGMLSRLREELLGSGSIAPELVPAVSLRALLDEFERVPTGANGYTVSMLFTFCAWARLIHRSSGS